MAEAGGKSFNTVDSKDQLMLVEIKDGKYGGYKQELLNDNLDPLATKFILCTGCNGLSREACSVGEDQNIKCLTCVPQDATHIPMKQARESVPNIPAKCALCTRGCIWKGDMGNVTSHLDECEFFVVSCPNNCQMILQRLELEEHLKSDCTHRDVTCEHCNGTVQFKDLTKHYEECQEFPLVCQNVCGGTFKRKELQNHINTDCPNTVISCSYKLFGCNAEMKRCELAVHNNNNILTHLECTKIYVTNNHTHIEGSLKQLQEEKVGSNQMTEVHQKIKEIEGKLTDPAIIKTLTDSLTKLQTVNIAKLEKDLAELTSKKCDLSQVTSLETRLATAEGKNATLVTENTTLKTELAAFKTEYETFKKDILAKIPAPAT